MAGKAFLAILGLGVGAVAALGSALGAGQANMTPDTAARAAMRSAGDGVRLAQAARGSYAEEPRGSFAASPPKPKPSTKKTIKSSAKKKKKTWAETPVVSAPTGDTP